jgi:DNA-binding MarR family transcriptional regulator
MNSAVRAWVRLLEVHKSTLAEIRRELSGEVTLPRFDLLAALEREDGQTPAALARHLLVTAANITGLVDRAERDGLVERRSDRRDRRAKRIHLTERGRRLFAEGATRHARRLDAAFASLSRRDLATLADLLGKLRAGLRGRQEDRS